MTTLASSTTGQHRKCALLIVALASIAWLIAYNLIQPVAH